MIGKLFGHTQVATTARYTHLAADPVKAAADHVSSAIASAIGVPCLKGTTSQDARETSLTNPSTNGKQLLAKLAETSPPAGRRGAVRRSGSCGR
jgi:hypothetical protein